jgi:hypothetical protein
MRDVLGIIRTFPPAFVTVERAYEVQDDLGEQHQIFVTVWQGEALVREVTSTVQRLEMGQIFTGVISFLIVGNHDFREGDFIRRRMSPNWASNHPQPVQERLYQVQRASNPFGVFFVLEANLYQQQEPEV